MRIIRISFIPLILILAACSSLMLKPADFSWPIESVLKVSDKGFVEDERYTFSLNVRQLFFAEFKDSTNFAEKELRVIRDKMGFYFIAGKDFKNVYIFESEAGGLDLEKKIEISKTTGLISPAFNQKSPNIELLDGSNKYLLNYKGIVR